MSVLTISFFGVGQKLGKQPKETLLKVLLFLLFFFPWEAHLSLCFSILPLISGFQGRVPWLWPIASSTVTWLYDSMTCYDLFLSCLLMFAIFVFCVSFPCVQSYGLLCMGRIGGGWDIPFCRCLLLAPLILAIVYFSAFLVVARFASDDCHDWLPYAMILLYAIVLLVCWVFCVFQRCFDLVDLGCIMHC